jgi:hypothetical protein
LEWWNLPYRDTINPNIIIDNTIKSYFSKFKLISNLEHLRKWSFKFSMEISIVLKNNIIIEIFFHKHVNIFLKSFVEIALIYLWYVLYNEWHDNIYKYSPVNNEHYFVPILHVIKISWYPTKLNLMSCNNDESHL